jgi:hypothetical protein
VKSRVGPHCQRAPTSERRLTFERRLTSDIFGSSHT